MISVQALNITQRLAPATAYLLVLVGIDELAERQQHLLVITQGIGTRTYPLFISEKALWSK